MGPARRPVGAQVIPTDEVEEDQFGTANISNQKYKIRFTPIDVGDHSIEVYIVLHLHYSFDFIYASKYFA